MGSIYRRTWKDKKGEVHKSDVLWIKWYDSNGRPMRESAETSKETEARKLLKSREGDSVKGVPVTPRVTRIRFSELAEAVVNDYKKRKLKSLRDLEMRLRLHVLPAFGHHRAAAITSDHIDDFILQRQEAGATNAEINRELPIVRRAFLLAMKATPPKALRRPTITMLEESSPRAGFFERPQFELLRSHLPETHRPILTTMYITGWRSRSEVLALEWSRVDFTAGIISLAPGSTKNKQGRRFPFTDELRTVLEQQRRYTNETQRKLSKVIPWVFHRPDGSPIRNFRKAWMRAVYNAGLPCTVEATPRGGVRVLRATSLLHDFRRTAVRNLVRAGIPEQVAMKLSGHKTRAVFDRYDITSEGDIKEAAAKLSDFHRATGTVTGTVTLPARKVR